MAIIDFDVHHGNGTQEIFFKDEAYYTHLHMNFFISGTGSEEERV